MRHAGLLAGLLAALILGPPAHADGAVDYRGLRITVPAGWPVYRLGPGSTECVRFDRHAVYLGPAGEEQLCPAHAVGRTEALHVEPLTPQTASFAAGLPDGGVRLGGLPAVVAERGGEIRVAVPEADVLVTGSYGTDPGTLRRVLAEIARVPDGERRGGGSRRWVRGNGFDTCSAPSLEAMRAWRDDFVAANIYIGGPARACPDGRLSRAWVNAVRDMGWRLIPTYVGPQAPCATSRPRFSAGDAAPAGRSSAADAANRAEALGLPRRSPIYLDLEAYDRRDAACRRAVLEFLDSWTKGIRAQGYTSGVYSSVGSGIRDLGEATGISKPTAIWFAHWDRKDDVRGDASMDDDWWPGHHRIKQFRGGHVERHGGVRLHVDSDAVDGYVTGAPRGAPGRGTDARGLS